MNVRRLKPSGTVLIAAVALVIGLEAPAAAHQVAHKISGSTIKEHSIAGNRLKSNTVTGRQIKESTLGTVPSARTVPPLVWHALTLRTGWTDVGAPLRPVAYAVDIQGLVHLRGEVSCPSSTICFVDPFVLPRGARPDVELDIPVYTGDEAVGDLDISPTGDTTVIDIVGSAAGSARAYSTFDGVVFSRS
jgi:hypothetical protein